MGPKKNATAVYFTHTPVVKIEFGVIVQLMLVKIPFWSYKIVKLPRTLEKAICLDCRTKKSHMPWDMMYDVRQNKKCVAPNSNLRSSSVCRGKYASIDFPGVILICHALA